MPEHTEGQSAIPAAPHVESPFKDSPERELLTQIAEKLDGVIAAIGVLQVRADNHEAGLTDLARRIADAEAEAEDIVRRATAPTPIRSRRPRQRRTDTILHAVEVVVVVIAGLGVVLAACASVRPHTTRARCPAACARAAAHHPARRDVDT